MPDYSELIERLEKLAGPDPATDHAIYLLLRPTSDPEEYARLYTTDPDAYWYWMASRPFTASLDAAVALVEKTLPEWIWDVSRTGTAWLLDPDNNEEIFTSTEAKSSLAEAMRRPATPAIALLIALFRALQQGGRDGQKERAE